MEIGPHGLENSQNWCVRFTSRTHSPGPFPFQSRTDPDGCDVDFACQYSPRPRAQPGQFCSMSRVLSSANGAKTLFIREDEPDSVMRGLVRQPTHTQPPCHHTTVTASHRHHLTPPTHPRRRVTSREQAAALVESANRKLHETTARWQLAFDLTLRRGEWPPCVPGSASTSAATRWENGRGGPLGGTGTPSRRARHKQREQLARGHRLACAGAVPAPSPPLPSSHPSNTRGPRGGA